jgi:hypothetical protein
MKYDALIYIIIIISLMGLFTLTIGLISDIRDFIIAGSTIFGVSAFILIVVINISYRNAQR